MLKELHKEQKIWAGFLKFFISVLLFFMFSLPAHSQITVTKIQDLSFGSFFATTSGTGTVTISNTGTRSSSNVILVTSTFNQAIFRLSARGKQNIASYTIGNINLTGSNGGSVSLTFGTPTPAAPYSMNNNATQDVSVGGTLTISTSASNPPGTYSGTFTFTVVTN